jgi:hypothetical protein
MHCFQAEIVEIGASNISRASSTTVALSTVRRWNVETLSLSADRSKKGVIRVALHLCGRQARLLVREEILEDPSEPLPAFDNLSLILRALGNRDNALAVVILRQFEQPDIGGEGRHFCSLARRSPCASRLADDGFVRRAFLTAASALCRFRPTWHCVLLSGSETFNVSTNTPHAMLLQRLVLEDAGPIEPCKGITLTGLRSRGLRAST